jgi:MFS family permease
MLCWGILTACHAALQSYSGLVAVRVLSGIFESAVPSILMLLSSQYFTRAEQASRFAIWYSGLGLAQMLGGLISFGFQDVSLVTHPPSSAHAGWRMMFLAIGLSTVLFGVALLLGVPDNPMNACFLNDEEKVNLLEYVKGNQAGIENKHFQPKQLVECFLDVQS